MRPLDEDESVVLDFLMSYAEIGRSLSARAQARDGGLILDSSQATILGLLDAVDRRIRQLQPVWARRLGPPRLKSLGVRRKMIRVKAGKRSHQR